VRLENTGAIVKAIESKTGMRVERADCVLWDKPGMYAVRAEFSCNCKADFILSGVKLHEVTPDNLRETTFDEWPPL
jgi:hypothetical protein